DGNAPESLAAFATRSPVVVFHADELTLSTGAATPRRRLLDRLALYRDPAAADHRARYARALKARHDLLRKHPTSGAAVEAYESLAAQHGAALTRARRLTVADYAPRLVAAFKHIAAPNLALDVRYRPGGAEDVDEALRALREARPSDARRPSAT